MDTEATQKVRTPEEIANLKRDWENDPCWDIEDTEGFEAHREELLAFSENCKKEWDEYAASQAAARRNTQRKLWGEDISDAALDYMDRLEERLSALEDKVSMIKSSALYTE